MPKLQTEWMSVHIRDATCLIIVLLISSDEEARRSHRGSVRSNKELATIFPARYIWSAKVFNIVSAKARC